MSATYCVGDAMKAAAAAPLTGAAFREIIANAPETCDRPDCSPGGCRAHVREALTGVWSVRKYQQKNPRRDGWKNKLKPEGQK